MNSNEKSNKLKISKILLAVGVCMLIVGIIIIVLAVTKYSQAKAQYQIDYDKWHDMWWNQGTADLSSKPDMPGFPMYGFLGVVLAFFSLIPIIIGARPFLTKMGAKMHKETLDYAGKDLSEAGVKTIEVAQPVIEKGAEVVTPIIGNLAGTIASEINNAKSNKFCSNCGAKVKTSDKFCSKCGNEISEE